MKIKIECYRLNELYLNAGNVWDYIQNMTVNNEKFFLTSYETSALKFLDKTSCYVLLVAKRTATLLWRIR